VARAKYGPCAVGRAVHRDARHGEEKSSLLLLVGDSWFSLGPEAHREKLLFWFVASGVLSGSWTAQVQGYIWTL
jgi:hypothetical protein